MCPAYSVRDMHRDFVAFIAFVLLPLAALGSFASMAAPERNSACVTILVEGMCCDFTAQPAIDELARVSGVIEVAPRYRERSLHVGLKSTNSAKASALWDAVRNSSLRPIQLVTEDGTFNSRPVE